MRRIGRILGLLLLLAAESLCAAPRNIVLIVTDDQSPDLGCYGNTAIKTPHLDALAKESVRLTHAFATTASCSASRSVILTGLHNHANGHYGHAHDVHHFSAFAKVQSLPVRMAEAGYRTAQCGKLHVEPLAVFKFDRELKAGPRSTIAMADACRDFIAEKSDKPFFLYFCPTDPHRDGTEIADDPLRPNSFGNRPQGYPGVKEVKYTPADVIVPTWLPDTPTCRAELAQYYQAISRLDQGVGRLIAYLKEAGVYDDTLVIFTADHGAPFPGAKTTAYEPGLHVPMLVKLPGDAPRGTTSDALVNLADLTPTLLDFAAGTPPGKADPAVHGRSFLHAIRDEHPAGFDELYSSHTFHEVQMYYPMRVVRTRTHKLIWNVAHPLPFPFASDLWAAPTWQEALKRGPETPYGKRTVREYIQRPAFELYDLKADPHEAKNLASDPAAAKTLAELQAKLKAFQKATRDPWLSKWEYE